MIKANVLIVEDEVDLAQWLELSLSAEGYRVKVAQNAEEGLALAPRFQPALVLLDIVLPGMDGLEFCQTLRRGSRVPVIFLTGRTSEADKIVGLKLGGDDYVTKPFSIKELLARIESVLRRAAPPSALDSGEGTLIGRMEVDFSRHEVRIGGRSVGLTPSEFKLLQLLIEARGKVISRDAIIEHLWGADQSTAIDARSVDQHVSRLRRKLGAEKRRITTVTNFGYRIQLSPGGEPASK